MARNRLTWQNVNAPDYGSTMTGMAAANRMFQDALGGLNTSLGSFITDRKNAQDEALLKQQQAAEAGYLRQMASVSGDTEQEAALRRSLSGNTNVSNDFLTKQLTDFRNAQLTGNTTAENLRQTIFDNDVTQQEQLARERAQALQARYLQLYANGNERGAQQLLAENEPLFAQLSLKDQVDMAKGGSTQAGDWQTRRTSEINRKQTGQNMYQSGIRFNNELTDRTEQRQAASAALQAQAGAVDNDGRVNLILSSNLSDVAKRQAIANLYTDPDILDMGSTRTTGTSQGRGTGQQQTNSGSASGSPDDAVGRSLELLQGGIGTRIAQEDDIYSVDGFIAAEKDNRSEAELISELVGPEGVFPEGDRGEALKTFQQVRAENPSLTRGQIAYAIRHNIRPDVPWYRKTLNDIFVDPALSGGGVRVDPVALRAQTAMTGSSAYMQQREAAREREAVERALGTMGEDRATAQENVRRAERLSKITGGNFDPSPYVGQVGTIDDIIGQTIQGLRGDIRFGELISDPDNPGQTITQGELRQRRLEEEKVRADKLLQKEAAKRQIPEVRELMEFLRQEENLARRTTGIDPVLEKRVQETQILLRELEALAR